MSARLQRRIERLEREVASSPSRELADLSEDEILDVLVARCRAALAEEGVAERIKRRGWGEYSVEFLVQDHTIKHVNVGILAHHRGTG